LIWIAIGLLAVAALAPLAVALDRRLSARGARDMALALHRSQLSELDRDLAENRILPTEHATAVLEVQRRLLAVADLPEHGIRLGSRMPVLIVLVAVPALAVGLYLVGGQPGMPSVTPGSDAAQEQRVAEGAALIEQLRERLATLDPATDQARQGYVLLGNVEEARGNDGGAVQAWRTALASRFDPVLAVRTAQAAERADGGLSSSSEALLRRALAAAPKDAPWREAVEERLRLARP
jgi:cytochrome c-type biogenesis protein CcmH